MNREFNQEVVASILEKGINLNIGESLSKGWQVCKNRMGSLIGFSFLFLLISMVGIFINLIPIAGTIVYIVVLIGLSLGYYVFITKHENGAIFSDFFKGFPFLGQAILASLVLFLLKSPFIIFSFYILPFNIGDIFSGDFQKISEGFMSFASQQESQSIMFTVISWIGNIYSYFITLIYLFVTFLIVDKKANFWQAMEGSRKIVMNKIGFFIGLLLVLGLINIGGALLFGLGLLVTIPLSFCTLYVIYKEVFGTEMGTAFDDRIDSFGE